MLVTVLSIYSIGRQWFKMVPLIFVNGKLSISLVPLHLTKYRSFRGATLAMLFTLCNYLFVFADEVACEVSCSQSTDLDCFLRWMVQGCFSEQLKGIWRLQVSASDSN